MHRTRGPLWTLFGLGAVTAALALAASSGATLSPASATFTLRAGGGALGTATETKTVGVPEKPASADIEIAIDTTGSMGPTIAQAKADATAIVTGVQGSVPDSQFAVIQFRDVGSAPEYQVVQSMTASASAVQTAINSLSAAGGGDAPEAYNRVFHESYTPALDGTIGWRAGSRKFVIVIGDAQPHGNLATQGFAGCANVSADAFTTSTELAGMKANGRTLMMIRQVGPNTSTSLQCYQSLAAAGFSGGAAVDGGGSLAAQIVALINAAFATVADVHLEVVSASPAPASASWISFTPASVGPVPAPSTQTFTLTATVPGGTPPNTYSFDIRAVADGVDIGHQALTIVVPAKQMTITPDDSNPIGTSHTVTATVFDVLGPFVGDTVTFTVSGGPAAVPSSGSAVTDASGNASFTFTNTPPNPGTNTITATDGPVSAVTHKTWVNAPPSCSGVVLNVRRLWPPNHKYVQISSSGATDPDIGDSATLAIVGITQDEPVEGLGDGSTAPDAKLTSPASAIAWVRAERSGLGDGRVYRLELVATDTHGATCSVTRTLGVPHDQGGGSIPIDSAPPSFNSLVP
jgi:von Willebrand factor type A domain